MCLPVGRDTHRGGREWGQTLGEDGHVQVEAKVAVMWSLLGLLVSFRTSISRTVRRQMLWPSTTQFVVVCHHSHKEPLRLLTLLLQPEVEWEQVAV